MTTRTTIDFGIDLGTTNTAIAMPRGERAEVIRNNEGAETTPSAVWADRRGRIHVGRRAREQQYTDPDNTSLEFKPHMGTTDTVKTLAGTTMTPELLSAEVLRSLRVDVGQRLGEPPAAAVITVPPTFNPNAQAATRRAAQLAGFQHTPLLPEPTAAAHTHGLHTTEDTTTWLVYDLGGGTFDATVLQWRANDISILSHAGDASLGGKLIDWSIVENLLIPAAVRQHPNLQGLSRGEPSWSAATSTLKAAAEQAKIEVSQQETADIEVELIDDRRRRYAFSYELSRADVERITEPLATRSLKLCREALRGPGIGSPTASKAIMVGGPTMMPYLRQRLADPAHGLGIPLAFDDNPMTVVARGAAVFAATQPIEAAPATVDRQNSNIRR